MMTAAAVGSTPPARTSNARTSTPRRRASRSLVHDGSTDGTATMIRDIAREDPRFKFVSLSRNFGHQAAIFAGLSFARGVCVAVMDGDLQDPPEVIPEMVRVWRKGAEVVYGVRTARKEGWFTRATAAIFYRLQARLTKTRM